MALQGAVRELCVGEGPLTHLWDSRLPDEAVNAVDTALLIRGGSGARRFLGSRQVVSAVPGLDHDAGVLWYHSGILFQARAADPELPEGPYDLLNGLNEFLAQFDGSRERTLAGTVLIRLEPTSGGTFFLGQDARGRPVSGLSFEAWHAPVWQYA